MAEREEKRSHTEDTPRATKATVDSSDAGFGVYSRESLIDVASIRFNVAPEIARAAATTANLGEQITAESMEEAIEKFLARPASVDTSVNNSDVGS